VTKTEVAKDRSDFN